MASSNVDTDTVMDVDEVDSGVMFAHNGNIVAPVNGTSRRTAWYWKNDDGEWKPYDGAVGIIPSRDSSNEKLEKSFLAGADNCVLCINQQLYEIDFGRMVQTNRATRKARQVYKRTFLLSITVLPEEWASMNDDQKAVMITLDPGSDDYRRVQGEFLKTMSSKTIHKIARVQNSYLYVNYDRKLSELFQELKRPPEELHLFHGTSDDSAHAICHQGFDMRLCGVHNTLFGKGSYFAVEASYADRYAGTSSQGHKLMFLCKVIVGSYDVGNANTVRPPPRDPTKPHELHHSCVDQMSNPSIFVIFNNDQAYPEFLISYS